MGIREYKRENDFKDFLLATILIPPRLLARTNLGTEGGSHDPQRRANHPLSF